MGSFVERDTPAYQLPGNLSCLVGRDQLLSNLSCLVSRDQLPSNPKFRVEVLLYTQVFNPVHPPSQVLFLPSFFLIVQFPAFPPCQ